MAKPAPGSAPAHQELNGCAPASLWSIEERLALRFDPAHAEKRRAEYNASKPSAVNAQSSGAAHATPDADHEGTVITIDGKRHPELFLPHEVFDGLMTGFTPDLELRGLQRAGFASGIESLGFDADSFWIRLWPVAKRYVELKYAAGRRSETAADRDASCRERFAALVAARNLFGAERFDMLLYEVVAPRTWMSSVATGTDPASELRREAAGCP